MTARRATAALVAALVICVPAVASGDDSPPAELPRPHVELTSGDGVLTTVGGIRFRIPANSHVITPSAYSELDVEMRRLQEQEVRLVAENKSLRETAASWQPGWKLLLSTAVIGLATGVYFGAKL